MMTRSQLLRRIIGSTGISFVVHRSLRLRTETNIRLSSADVGGERERESIRYYGRTFTALPDSISRHHSVRRFHSNAADMSSAEPSEATSSAADPSTAKESTTTIAKEEQQEVKKEEKKLPPLKGAEFRAYNRLAEHMDAFHAHFRTSWNALWAAACAGNGKGKGSSRSGRGVINDGLSFLSQLEIHHSIEETYIFPILARKMPEFRTDGKGGKGAAELLQQHREIHVGMEGMEKYLNACSDGEKELDMDVLKEQMQTWGAVLWKHLDQEVQTLGAENMRKYWTVEEIRRIPM
ncbi:hypothetical protein F4806DRAFT_478250 [Annulohypoxylon nitens]|nr:hypothetical protein F4806DRAFT_478250 [Annulohypoxylon nitens]